MIPHACSICRDKENVQRIRNPQGLEGCKEFASSIGWELKSIEFVNRTTNMNWVCANGHTQSLPFKTVRTAGKMACKICSKPNFSSLIEQSKEAKGSVDAPSATTNSLANLKESEQLAFVQQIGFIPTQEQISWGTKHLNGEIKELFVAYPSVKSWETYQEMRRLKAKLAEQEKSLPVPSLKS